MQLLWAGKRPSFQTEMIAMTEYLLYTSENCVACPHVKSALKRLGIEYREIMLKNGMVLPPDVRSVPTLAIERDGRRTTVCIGWPGSIGRFEKLLMEKGVSFPGKRR